MKLKIEISKIKNNTTCIYIDHSFKACRENSESKHMLKVRQKINLHFSPLLFVSRNVFVTSFAVKKLFSKDIWFQIQKRKGSCSTVP
jgi:hypothetical protein